MKAKIWLALKKIEWSRRSQDAVKLPLLCQRASLRFFSRQNVLAKQSPGPRPALADGPPHSGKSFSGRRHDERRAAQDFVRRPKSGRPFAQTIELDGSMVAHEPKFFRKI